MELALTHHTVNLQDGRIIDVATEEINLENIKTISAFAKSEMNAIPV